MSRFTSLLLRRFTRRRVIARAPGAKAGNPYSLRVEPCASSRARMHAELPVGARQCGLHGVLGDEERRRDVAVRPALGNELGDSPLGLRQLAARRCAASDSPQLGARLLGPQRSAEPLEDSERLLERQARGTALLRPPLRHAEREQCACMLERILRAGVVVERALEATLGADEITPRSEEQPPATSRDREAQARSSARERSSQGTSFCSAASSGRPRSAPPACPPAPGATPGSSRRTRSRISHAARGTRVPPPGSPSESSMKPSTQRWPD